MVVLQTHGKMPGVNLLLLNCLIASNHLNKHGHVDPSLLANMLLSISHNKGLKIGRGGMDRQKSPCTSTGSVYLFLCPISFAQMFMDTHRAKAVEERLLMW